MPNYTYIAKSFDGETRTGTSTAQDERQLAQDLKREGMVLVKVVAQETKGKPKFSLSLPFLGVSSVEKIMMTRNIGVMFATGLSLVKSFDVLVSQARNKKMKSALSNIKEKINKGESLSAALANYPDIFSELFVNMVKVGEESGTLDEVFSILSLQLQKEHELKSKIKNAMIYPVIILVVMVVVGIVMVTFVLPSLKVFFASLAAEIPFYTRVLLYLGDLLYRDWYLFILVGLLLFLVAFLILRTKKGKRAMDTFTLKMPVISSIIKKNNSALLIRSLSSLIISGVPLTRSLEISSKIIGNHYFKEALIEANEKIKKGGKLSTALKPYQNIFPIGVIEMMEVGEETGKTSDILKKLADFYEQEAIIAVEKLTILIEPILILVLGVGVGIFALSIIQPMYSSLQSINQ